MPYEQLFRWAFGVGKSIINNERYDREKGVDLLKKLIFAVRAEETPGRFLEKLSELLTEYKTNTSISADINMHPELFSREWHADSFYYMKSAILTGLLNALGSER